MASDIEIRSGLLAPAGEGEETAEIYRREARAIYDRDKEGAAALLIDAAYANDRDDNPVDSILRDLNLAIAICPDTPWVYASAHRLMLKLGLWKNALSLIETEITLSLLPDEKLALCLTASDLCWIVGNDETSALKYIQRALEIDPNCTGALYNGLWLGDTDTQESFAESLAKILGAPAERAVLYGLAGSLLSAKGNEVQALDCYTLAAQSDRNNPYALLRYAILNERFGKLPEAAQAYAQIAQIFDDHALKGEFFKRAGIIQFYCGAHERSCFFFNEALKHIDDKFTVTWLARDAFNHSGNAQRVVELEKQLIDLSDDNETKAAHFLNIADVCINELNSPEMAIDALENASRSGYSDIADPRLIAIYESRSDWEHLSIVLNRMTKSAVWDKPCLDWLLGDALWRCNRTNEAIEVFTGMKSFLARFKLDCAYENTKNDEAHSRMLESWIQSTNDIGTHDALLSQLLTILTERLHAPEIAIQYVQELKLTQVSRDIAWKRLHLNLELSHFAEVADGLIQLASETTDRDEALMWFMEAALIHDREMHDPDGAVDILLSVHEAAPTFVPAVIYLHHIAMREQKVDTLLTANLWRSAFLMSASSKADLACENALLCLTKNDRNNAVIWFEKARKLAPLNTYYLKKYIDLLKESGLFTEASTIIREALDVKNKQPQQVIQTELLESEFDTDENDIISDSETENINAAPALSKEQTALKEMMLDMQSFCLKHPSGTDFGKQQCFELHPSVSTALDFFLEKASSENISSIGPILSDIRIHLTDISEETKALMDWAEAELIRIQCPNGADSKTASAILTLMQRSLSLRYGTCLRADILRTLREISLDDVSLWLEKYASETQDKWMAMSLCREAALHAIWINKDYDLARRVLAQSLIKENADRRTLWTLEQFSAISEDWKALGVFRERLAQFESNSLARLQVLKSALAPYVDENLTEHAVRVAQECLKLNGHTFPALVTLAHVAEDNSDFHSLACIADRLSEASAFSENRTQYGLWAAQLWAKSLAKPDHAIASLGRLLAQEPTCLPAINMSEQLYLQLEKYDQLGRIYARAIAALPDGETQCSLLRKQAQLLANQLNDAPSACLSLSRIIAQFPADIDALNMLTDLLILQERWSDAVDIIEQLSKVVEDPEQKKSTNIKLAEILIHQLEQPERAKRILKRHLVQFEHDMPALKLLYDIAWTERNWNDAKVTLEEICQDEGSVEARHARMEFTKVAREAGWSHDFRTLYERQAIAAVIGFRNDFDTLVEDYRTHNELNRLIDVTKRELGQLGNVEQIAQYRGCIAALLVANRQHREALVFLSEIIHDAQNTDWAYLARAQALTSAGQLESAVGEFRRTLARNIHLDDAIPPFLEVLKQTGDTITLASVTAIRELRTNKPLTTPWTRCVKGAPRGYFDVDHMPLARAFVDAQRYLRTMTPYAFELFNDNLQMTPLDSSHWAFGRCHRLFGQNFELKQAFVARGLKHTLCRVKLQTEPALIFDESILDENNTIDFDFWAAYAMHQAITGGCVIDVLTDTSVEALFSALCQAKPETALAQNMKKQLFHSLPRAERKLFKDGVPFLAPSWSDFRNALQTRAACVAAVISASPACAIHARPNDEALQIFLVSESFVRAVKTYWTQGLAITA